MISLILTFLLFGGNTPSDTQKLQQGQARPLDIDVDYCSLEVITCEEETIEEIITRVCKEKDFDQCDKLKRIAFCESSNNPNAKNPKSSASGIFQILKCHGLSISERQDPEIATQWAIDNFNNGKPWASSEKCWR